MYDNQTLAAMNAKFDKILQILFVGFDGWHALSNCLSFSIASFSKLSA
jgi:hypothetical protein